MGNSALRPRRSWLLLPLLLGAIEALLPAQAEADRFHVVLLTQGEQRITTSPAVRHMSAAGLVKAVTVANDAQGNLVPFPLRVGEKLDCRLADFVVRLREVGRTTTFDLSSPFRIQILVEAGQPAVIDLLEGDAIVRATETSGLSTSGGEGGSEAVRMGSVRTRYGASVRRKGREVVREWFVYEGEAWVKPRGAARLALQANRKYTQLSPTAKIAAVDLKTADFERLGRIWARSEGVYARSMGGTTKTVAVLQREMTERSTARAKGTWTFADRKTAGLTTAALGMPGEATYQFKQAALSAKTTEEKYTADVLRSATLYNAGREQKALRILTKDPVILGPHGVTRTGFNQALQSDLKGIVGEEDAKKIFKHVFDFEEPKKLQLDPRIQRAQVERSAVGRGG